MKVRIEFWKPDSNAVIKFYLIKPNCQNNYYGLKFYYSLLYFKDLKMSVEYKTSSIYSKFENVLSEIFRREL